MTGFIAQVLADLIKVGPKGYIHNWIFVGAPGIGDLVYHPRHGHGKVTGHDEHGNVHVDFGGGKKHHFQTVAAAHPQGTTGLMRRREHPAGKDEFADRLNRAKAANARGRHDQAAEHYDAAAELARDDTTRRQMQERAAAARAKTTPAGGGLLDQLNNAASREAARALLEGRSRAELDAMAKPLNIPRHGSMRGDDLRREIVDATVGRRLDTIATRGFEGLRPDFPVTDAGFARRHAHLIAGSGTRGGAARRIRDLTDDQVEAHFQHERAELRDNMAARSRDRNDRGILLHGALSSERSRRGMDKTRPLDGPAAIPDGLPTEELHTRLLSTDDTGSGLVSERTRRLPNAELNAVTAYSDVHHAEHGEAGKTLNRQLHWERRYRMRTGRMDRDDPANRLPAKPEPSAPSTDPEAAGRAASREEHAARMDAAAVEGDHPAALEHYRAASVFADTPEARESLHDRYVAGRGVMNNAQAGQFLRYAADRELGAEHPDRAAVRRLAASVASGDVNPENARKWLRLWADQHPAGTREHGVMHETADGLVLAHSRADRSRMQVAHDTHINRQRAKKDQDPLPAHQYTGAPGVVPDNGRPQPLTEEQRQARYIADTASLAERQRLAEQRDIVGHRIVGEGTSVAALKEGDWATVRGVDQFGQPTVYEGYVSGIGTHHAGKPGRKTREHVLGVSMAGSPSGADAWHGQVFTHPAALTEAPTKHVATHTPGLRDRQVEGATAHEAHAAELEAQSTEHARHGDGLRAGWSKEAAQQHRDAAHALRYGGTPQTRGWGDGDVPDLATREQQIRERKALREAADAARARGDHAEAARLHDQIADRIRDNRLEYSISRGFRGRGWMVEQARSDGGLPAGRHDTTSPLPPHTVHETGSRVEAERYANQAVAEQEGIHRREAEQDRRFAEATPGGRGYNNAQRRALDDGVRWSGNPHLRVSRLEALSKDEFAGLLPEDQERVTDALGRLDRPGGTGTEIQDRVRALRARWGLTPEQPKPPSAHGSVVRDALVTRRLHMGSAPGQAAIDEAIRMHDNGDQHDRIADHLRAKADELRGEGLGPDDLGDTTHRSDEELAEYASSEANRLHGLAQVVDSHEAGSAFAAPVAPTVMTPREHVDALWAMGSRADAQRHLAGLKPQELHAVAEEAGFEGHKRLNGAQLREELAERLVGSRLDSAAIRGTDEHLQGLPSPGARPRSGFVDRVRDETPKPDAGPARRLDSYAARRDAVREHGALTREQFNALPEERRNTILDELGRIAESGDKHTVPSNRTRYGQTIRGGAAPHVTEANNLRRRFTAPPPAPAPDNSPAAVVERLRGATSVREARRIIGGGGAGGGEPSHEELDAIAHEGRFGLSAAAGGVKKPKRLDRFANAAFLDAEERRTGVQHGHVVEASTSAAQRALEAGDLGMADTHLGDAMHNARNETDRRRIRRISADVARARQAQLDERNARRAAEVTPPKAADKVPPPVTPSRELPTGSDLDQRVEADPVVRAARAREATKTLPAPEVRDDTHAAQMIRDLAEGTGGFTSPAGVSSYRSGFRSVESGLRQGTSRRYQRDSIARGLDEQLRRAEQGGADDATRAKLLALARHFKPDFDAGRLAADEHARQTRQRLENEAGMARIAAENKTREEARRAAFDVGQRVDRPAGTESPQVPLRQRAKKGDLAIMEVTTSSYDVGAGRTEHKQYELVRIGSADRNGSPTSYHPLSYGDPGPGDRPVKLQSRDRYSHVFHIVPADRIDAPAAVAAARANPWHPDKPAAPDNSGRPFDSMDEIKAVLAPHVKAPPRPKPVKHVQRPLVPAKPRRIPQTPGGYKEPTGLDVGAEVTWEHRHADGTSTVRTGRVWSAAPRGSTWVIPDEKLPTDQYHAIAVDNRGRGGKLDLHSSDSHELTAHAAEAAHVHRNGPPPARFTQADMEQHMREAGAAVGADPRVYTSSGMTYSDDPTLRDILRGFSPYTSADQRMYPEAAVARLRHEAQSSRDNMAQVTVSDPYGHYDRRYQDWKNRAALFDELANRLETDWARRGTTARAKGSVHKSVPDLDEVLRAAEAAWVRTRRPGFLARVA